MAELRLSRAFQWRDALRHRMAGARRRSVAARRPGNSAELSRSRPLGRARFALAARRGLAAIGAAALALGLIGPAQAQVLSTRIWPAKDYTRVTLESKTEIKFSVFGVKNPERLVVDLEGVELGAALAELDGKVATGDPYIEKLRVGRNRPGVVRLVLDLKTEVRPQVFTLKPVAEYGYRLVLDLYPVVAPDPLAALIEQSEKEKVALPVAEKPSGKTPDKPKVARLATIVIDAGHGGEDPGARGRLGSREKDITLVIARRLKGLVDAEADMRAVLTRDADFYLPLQERVDKARRVKADLFVSVHADAFIKSHARGSSVFALSERRATSEAARW